MNPAVIIGAIPAFWLTLIITTSNAGICEYKTRDGGKCRYEWGFVVLALGLGGAVNGAIKMFEVGYKTYNPDLHTPSVAARREEDRNEVEVEGEQTEPEPSPEPIPEFEPDFEREIATEPEVIPTTEILPARRNSMDRNDIEEEAAKESLAARMEKAYEKKVEGKTKKRSV